jgi:hypothetical protein
VATCGGSASAALRADRGNLVTADLPRARACAETDRGWSIIEQVEAVSRDVRNHTLLGLTNDELTQANRVLELICQNLARQLGQDE